MGKRAAPKIKVRQVREGVTTMEQVLTNNMCASWVHRLDGWGFVAGWLGLNDRMVGA